MRSATISVITVTNGDHADFILTKSSIPKCQNLEWIIVSSLATRIPEYESASVVIMNANKGIFQAMNEGLENASGDVALFLNAGDSLYSKEVIELILQSYEMYHWKWAVGSAIRDGLLSNIWKPPASTELRFKYASHSYCHQSTFYDRKFLISSGNFIEESLISDWAKSLQLSMISDPFIIKSIVSNVDSHGISSKMSFSYRISEPLKIRKKLQITVFNSFVDVIVQICIVLVSNIKRLVA
jgi:glycosyltransferase involved in cell wall biosynthesis